MPIFDSEFNAEEYQSTQQDWTKPTLLPEGDYTVIVVESDVKDNAAGSGKYCQFKFMVIDGPYKGEYLTSFVNVSHSNPKAQQIGREQLANLTRAVGKKTIRATEDLHAIPLVVSVKIVEKPGKKDPEKLYKNNDIKAYRPIERPTLAQAVATTQTAVTW